MTTGTTGSSTPVEPTSTPIDVRAALASWIDRLATLEAHRDEPTRASVIHGGERKVEVDPWCRTQILRSMAGDPDPTSELVARAIAFQARSVSDLDVHDGGDATARLSEDARLGAEIAVEIQDEVDRLVSTGQVDLARRLTALRKGFARSLEAVEDVVGKADVTAIVKERKRARLLAESEELDRAAETRRKAESAQQAASATDATVIAVRGKRRRASASGKLFVLLVLLVAAWGVLVGWPMYEKRQHALPTLGMNDFSFVPEVAAVTARPPSVFVEVDARAWADLTADSRTSLVTSLSSVAAAAGYRGVHVRLTDGRSAGQWLESRGVRVFEPRGAVPSTPSPGPRPQRAPGR